MRRTGTLIPIEFEVSLETRCISCIVRSIVPQKEEEEEEAAHSPSLSSLS